MRAIGRELGVRYLVTGGLRIANEQALVTAQLADAETGRQIWNRRFEVPRAQLAELQAEVALAVVNELEPELNRAELALIRRRGSDNLDAWACYRQAIGALTLGGWNEEAVEEALSHLARAISLDPGFAVAHALVGLISALANVYGLRSLDERARADVRRSVEAALAAVVGSEAALTAEAADVLYHLLVMLAARGVKLAAVMAELKRRTGQSGLAEKAARPTGGD